MEFTFSKYTDQTDSQWPEARIGSIKGALAEVERS